MDCRFEAKRFFRGFFETQILAAQEVVAGAWIQTNGKLAHYKLFIFN